uniref:ABC transporter domain-containing protein n=1 Tax=Phytophthora ramorum TaxID=164328 RepID=H3GXU4_PHYRM
MTGKPSTPGRQTSVVEGSPSMPQVEICFKNLSVSAEVVRVEEHIDDKKELPTVFNTLRGSMSVGLLPSKKCVEIKSLLRNVSGCIKPGSFTLVLGRPGSGKSTLLKALAGQLPLSGGSRVQVDGDITYNGAQQKDMPESLPHFVGYTGQDDDHFATLSVKETLQFAFEFAGGANKVAGTPIQTTPEQVTKWLGLEHCQDTILGDATSLRGVSGGERKRVTLGEGIIGGQSVLLLDEISTGLDAAATLDIISLLKHTFVQEQQRAVVVSLLQPAPEVFALFDEVLLLHSGEVLYYGPRAEVCQHFDAIGLHCSPGRAIADFLLDIGTSQQLRYETIADEISAARAGSASDAQPRLAQELSDHFQRSAAHHRVMKYLDKRMSSPPSESDITKSLELTHPIPEFPQSFWSNTMSLTRRQLLLVTRNTAFLRARGVMSIFMGLIYGSTFFQASPTNIQIILGLCFQAVLFLMLGQTAQIASFVDARVVLAKQRRAHLTSSASYVVACCAGQLPAALAETVVFGSITYWMSGLDFDASSSFTLATRFLVFEGVLFLTLLGSIAWFFVVAAISPDRNVAFPVAMASIIVFIVFAGFVVPKNQFPDWLIWGYWLDPLAWSLRALAVNAYRSESLDKCEYGAVNYCQLADENMTAGEYYLSRFDVPSAQVIPVRDAAVLPVTLAFEDLWYSVSAGDGSRDLLKGVNGYALPGRKNSGSVRGQILLNGRAASELTTRRSTGYCEQVDVHSDASTIREALIFSAFLRQESTVSDHEKRATVEECLELLELREIADQMIRGRSHEQLKRVSIGVELAARSSVLFLDEPTSGLDAQAAAIVMRTIRRVADESRCTVVCTIHQPSASLFELFDMLLLLQLGGEVVYFGDSRVDALQAYFEALPGARSLPHGYNPATWILECVGAGVTQATNDTPAFAQIFQASAQHAMMMETLSCQQQSCAEMVELNFSTKRAASSWVQMRLLIARFQTLYWRTPSYSLSRLILALGLGLIIGALFSGADYSTYQGINAGIGGVFLSLNFSGIVAINSVLPLAVQDRAAFYRERSAQSYNALWYFLGATLAEIPYVIVSSFLFTVLSFTIMGFTDGGDANWGVSTIALYWLVMTLFTLQQVYLGQFLAYALPGVELASLAGTLFSSILLLFSGFNPPSSSIPRGYRWLHVLAPQRYTLAALVALVFGDCDSGGDSSFGCQQLQDTPLELEGLSVKQYVESVFEMKHDDIARNIAVTAAFAVGFQLLGLVSLRLVSHQRK